MKENKQLFIRWVHQLNEPVYILLEIIDKDEETIRLSPEMNSIAFIMIMVQKPNNINNLALVTMTRSVFIFLS